MSKFYEVLTSSRLGDPWGEGNKNQTYWCQVDGIEHAVMINKQSDLNPGDQVYGDLITDDGQPFQGKKPYFKFKGAMIPQGTQRPQSKHSQGSAPQQAPVDDSVVPEWFNPYAIMLKRIHDAVVADRLPDEQPKPGTEKIGGGDISKEELEDIFGGEMADPVDVPDKEDV